MTPEQALIYLNQQFNSLLVPSAPVGAVNEMLNQADKAFKILEQAIKGKPDGI